MVPTYWLQAVVLTEGVERYMLTSVMLGYLIHV